MLGVADCIKTHRLRHHLAGNLKSFGNAFFTDTLTNESLHKDLKACLRAINKRKKGIGLKLLKKNVIATLLSETSLRAYAKENELYLACERGISPVENGENELKHRKHTGNLKTQIAVAKAVNRLLKNLRRSAEKYSCSEAFHELFKAGRGLYSALVVRKKRK